jgi:hypothetical protein
MSVVADCSLLMRDHMGSLSMALVTSLMAVCGGDISRVVRNSIRSYNFFVRAGIFFFLVVVGYGALTVIVGSVLAKMLRALDNNWLSPAVAVFFLIIAIAAEERRQI